MNKRYRKIRYIKDKEIRKNGRKDGKDYRWIIWKILSREDSTRVEPSVEDKEPSNYERYLCQIAKENLERIKIDYREEDTKLKEEYCQVKGKAEELEKKLKDIKAEEPKRENEINKLNSQSENLEKEKDKLKEEKDNLEIYVRKHKRSFWITIGAILIFLGEATFNVQAFYLLEASRFETWVMALAVIVAIPFSAHYIGSSLKNENATSTEKALAFSLTIMVILGLLGVGWMREQYLYDLIKDANSSISPFFAGLFFIVLNLLLFVLFIMVEYTGVVSNLQEYKEKIATLKQNEKKLKECDLKLSSIRQRKDEIEKEPEKIKEELSTQKSKITNLKTIRIGLCQKYQLRVREEIKIYEGAILLYRRENFSARKFNRTKPKSFDNTPNIDISQMGILEREMTEQEIKNKLDWTCFTENLNEANNS